jgi:ectoine hydroxylase-related dioxygenase (phytanoyl-CoA dioxygenase family)
MLSEREISQFEDDGFLLGPCVLDASQVRVLNDEIMRVIEQRDRGEAQPVLLRNLSGSETSPVWQIVNIWQASGAFADLIANKTIAQEVAQLTKARELRLFHDQIQYKPAGRGGVNMWHQDAPYWPIISGGTQVTAWIALDDADEANGCMKMVPGSHRWGNQIEFLESLKSFEAMPGEFEGNKIDVKTSPVPAGHVHYHHALTWHGSPANTSNRPRRAIALHFMNEQTLYRGRGEHPMKRFVHVPDNAPIRGDAFPLVWNC